MNSLSQYTNVMIGIAKQTETTCRFVRTKNAPAFRKKWITASACVLLAMTMLLPAQTQAQDITTGLIGHWKLDETSGTTAADSSGNGNDGTMQGGLNATSTTIGKVNAGLNFDGVNNTIGFGDLDAVEIVGAHTYSLWVKPSDTDTENFGFGDFLVGKELSGTGSGVIWDWETTAGRFGFMTNGGGITWGATNKSLNTWYLVTGIYDGANARIYVDSILENSEARTYTPNTTADFNIGSWLGARNSLSTLDDIRIYNRALTPADVTALYDRKANCESETDAGKIIYNEDYRNLQYCDGTDWQSIGKSASILHGQKAIGENYDINAVEINRDTENDQLSQIGPLAGISDSKRVTLSMWFQFINTSNGFNFNMAPARSFTFSVDPSAGRISPKMFNGSNSTIWEDDINVTINNTQWHHVLFSLNLDTGSSYLYHNDVLIPTSPFININDFIDFDTDPSIGFRFPGNTNTAHANFADIWFDVGTHLDLSVEANRRKFINADGQAINLGTDGSLPTGSAPDIFLSGDTDNWHTNKGTGGGFTENGTLTNATTLPPSSTSKKLVGWWKLDETSGTIAFDSSGNGYDGLIQGGVTQAATGVVNNGYEFDGVNGCLSIANGLTENMSDSGTFSFWVKVESIEDLDSFISIGDRYFNVMRTSTNTWRVQLDDSANDSFPYNIDIDAGSNSIVTNEWAHFVNTYDSAGSRLYKNGVLMATSAAPAISSTYFNANTDIWFGCDRNIGTRSIDGFMDDIRIYNFALDANEIAELYAASSEFYEPNAVNFTGTNNLQLGSPLSAKPDTTKFTMSFWVRQTTPLSLIQIFDDTSSAYTESTMNIGNTGRLDLSLSNSADATSLQLRSSDGALNDDEWHHVLISVDTSDPTKRSIYIDDALDAFTTPGADVLNGLIEASVEDLYIGRRQNGSRLFTGDLADMWLNYGTYFDFSVEANRRKFIDESGNAVFLGADGSVPTGAAPDIFLSGDTATWHTNLGTGGGFTENGTLTDAASAPLGAKQPRYCSNPSQPEGTLIYNSDEHVMQYCDGYTYRPLGPPGDGGGGCSAPSGVAGMMFYNADFKSLIYCEGDEWIGVGKDNTDALLENGLVGHWTLDETSGTIAADSSGNGNNGTMQNGLDANVNSSSGAINTAINFDGVNDVIRIPHTPDLTPGTNDFTTSLWFKTSDANQQGILFAKRNVSGNFNQWAMTIGTPSSGSFNASRKVSMFLLENHLSTGWSAHSTADVIDGDWHHFVIRRQGSNAPEFFVDGSQVAITETLSTLTHPANINTSSDWTIGQGGNDAFPTDAEIDDVRIYNRALSPAEIQTLAERGECTSIGDTCKNGSILAGFRDYGPGSEPVYMAAAKQSFNIRWKTTDGTNDITSESNDDGKINVANLNSDISNFPAIQTCDSLSEHGYADWYLPAQNELSMIKNNLSLSAATDWSSTEQNSPNARVRSAADFSVVKTSNTPDVYCIRRNSTPAPTPDACAGTPEIGDRCADGTIYAGTTVGGLPFYVAPTDEGNFAYGGASIDLNGDNSAVAPELDDDGLANTDWLLSSGNGDHDAAQQCRNRGADWYLPAIDELNRIYTNLVVGAPDADSNEVTDDFGFHINSSGPLNFIGIYWSSSETNNNASDRQLFWNGSRDSNFKTSAWRVRCVRRDVPPDPCAGSPSIGDTCADGSVYAGLSPDGNVAMYTTPADQGNIFWNDGSTTSIDTPMIDCTTGSPGAESTCQTGAANTAFLEGLTGYTALAQEACTNLTDHGHSDWYLPAADELNVLYANHVAIGGFTTTISGTFGNFGRYWSSSESVPVLVNSARSQRFDDGTQESFFKNRELGVRCVRK